MIGKSVLVTGASGGIGKATACGLAAMGAHVAIVGRDKTRTEAAAREIGIGGGGEVDVFVANLSAQAEVRRLADEVLQRLTRVDVLINNVGGYWNTRHVTVDGDLEGAGVGLAGSAAEGVDGGSDVDEADLGEYLMPALTGQPAGDSTGP